MAGDSFQGKTFDDFLLEPQEGVLEHRGEASLESWFSKNIKLNLPVVAANMDTVTGPAMCIAMAQEGGLGVLPRSDSIPIVVQADWVQEVKRAENFIIPDPYTIGTHQSVGEARAEMQAKKVGTLLVVNSEKQLVGMITARRVLLCENNTLVYQYMTDTKNLAYVWRGINSIEQARMELIQRGAEQLPIIDDQSKIRGLITAKDIASLTGHTLANKDNKGRLRVAAAISATRDFLERAAELIKADVDVLVMDIAHAHNGTVVGPAVKNFRQRFGDFELVVGNVATMSGASFLVELGVQGIKAGIGSGYGCRTRLEAATGVPQAQAIRSVWKATKENDCPIVSDGGVRTPGHVAMSLLLGASSVMLGSFLAGTDEAPGEIIQDPATGIKYKMYRGMTSPEAKLEGVSSAREIKNVEGQTQRVPYVGSVKDILARVREGLQSMVSYAGEDSLAKVRVKINPVPEDYLIALSSAAIKESFVR